MKSEPIRKIVLATLVSVILTSASTTMAQKRKPAKHPSVCGNPNLTCPSEIQLDPYALPFRFPKNGVIYETELFYAVILRSVSSAPDSCDNFIPEPERLAAQILFTNN